MQCGTSGADAEVEVEVEVETEEPLLVASAQCSYSEMLALLETLNFGSNVSSVSVSVGSAPAAAAATECCRDGGGITQTQTLSERVRVLPPDLAKQVLQFLVVQRVDFDTVRVVRCSSHDQVHPLAACLSDDETTWWISGEHSMPRGRGLEYVELSVGATLRRLQAVSLKIPPLPQGPLSVREFRIEAPVQTMSRDDDGEDDGEDDVVWTAVSPVFTVDNRTGFQRFVLADPIDVQQVRLVCLSNQIDPYVNVEDEVVASDHVPRRFECVGFFSLRLE